MVLELSKPGGISSLGVVGHARASENDAVSERPETLPARQSKRRLLQQIRRQGGWARWGPRIRAMLEEEAAHGHAFLFVPVLVGGGAAIWFVLPRDPPAMAIAAFFCLFAAATVCVRYWTGSIPRVLFPVTLVLAGSMLAQIETWRRSTIILDSSVTTVITGEVHRREPAGEGRWRYFIRLSATEQPVLRRPPEDIVLLARARHAPFQAGDAIRGRARLSPPSGPALPGLNDFAFRSYYDGIGAVGFFYGAPQPAALLQSGQPPWSEDLERWIFALRGTIADRIRATVPGDPGAFAAAIVTDERRAISKATTEALRVSGLAHIVAISGLNMALAAGIFFVGLRICLGLFTGFAQAWPVKKIAAFGALLMATAYYLISGFAVSAERAYLMMAVMLVAVFFDRAAISLRNVALSALVIMAVSPSQVMGPSFQMSFAATVALVAGYALWSRQRAQQKTETPAFARGRLAPVMAGWQFMAGIFATSLVGGLSTAIYSVDHFHRLAGYGLVANLAVMPIISFLVMPMGLVGMLLMPFGLDAFFLKLMGLGLEAVIAVARQVAGWGGDVGVGRQHPWFLGGATAGFLLLTLLRTRLRLIGLPLMGLAFLLSWQAQRAPPPDILVSEDGTLVALLGPSVSTNRTRPPEFIFGQWQRALLLADPQKPVVSPAGDMHVTGAGTGAGAQRGDRTLSDEQLAHARDAMRTAFDAAAADPGRFRCQSKAWCVAVTGEGVGIAVVEDGRLAGIACDLATFVVAPRARFDECWSGVLLVNGTTLRKTGSLEVHLNGTPEIRRWRGVAAMAEIDRPWSRHRAFDWRTDAFDRSLPGPFARLVSGNGG